ncbi:hypothetical protein HK099_007001 [Clydaea vesicula]|uniref:Uncharacterized protein n=1 Tax=Clydaea vesicula TaxID=447962 RepID=A0AAD5U0J5_9FUNG|nr:hypothetical protein HK099_007001 [Clydaea vesicula]KAJ3385190.1 hypothetical protein HDU92_003166 [Lobulomyces angularis]
MISRKLLGSNLIKSNVHLKNTKITSILFLSKRFYASNHKDDHPKPKTKHPEEYLEVARNWPHEYYHPEHYNITNKPSYTHPSEFTEENPLGTETVEDRVEDFSSPIWTKVLIFGVLGLTLYRTNEFYSQGKDVHPFTLFLGNLRAFKNDDYEENRKWVQLHQKEANDRMIDRDWEPAVIHRVRFSDIFQRASDHLIEPGTQIDVSDIKFKHSWQDDDEIFGVPYPNKEN